MPCPLSDRLVYTPTKHLIVLLLLKEAGIVELAIITGTSGSEIVVGSIPVALPHMLHTHPLVHHRRPLHIVVTVQDPHLITHTHHVNTGITSLLAVLQIITAHLHTMINRLGGMIHPAVMIEDRRGQIVGMGHLRI